MLKKTDAEALVDLAKQLRELGATGFSVTTDGGVSVQFGPPVRAFAAPAPGAPVSEPPGGLAPTPPTSPVRRSKSKKPEEPADTRAAKATFRQKIVGAAESGRI